jgi:hypothetical protein
MLQKRPILPLLKTQNILEKMNPPPAFIQEIDTLFSFPPIQFNISYLVVNKKLPDLRVILCKNKTPKNHSSFIVAKERAVLSGRLTPA